MKSKSKGKDKGVSEVVGYILTFAIVIAAVTLIYASGMPMIEQTSETAALQSMKTSFISLQSNVKKVALDQSPVRTVKFNLIKGSIGAKESPDAGWLNVTVDGTLHNQPFGNIEYTIGSKKVIYENGAVIEYTTGGNIIASDPPIYFTNYSGNKNVFISVINVSGSFSAGGGIAEMHLRHDDNTTVIYAHKNVTTLNIDITSSYNNAWERYLCDVFETSPPLPVIISNCNLTLVTHNVSIS